MQMRGCEGWEVMKPSTSCREGAGTGSEVERE